jgi:WD40 repeat protein
MSSSLIFSTRAVHGITTDPFCSNRWASFSDDGIVRIFDIRKVGEPVLSFSTDFKNGIKQIDWDKSRSGILGVIGRDSSIIKIFEIQDISHPVDTYEDDIADDDIPILTSVRKGIFFSLILCYF